MKNKISEIRVAVVEAKNAFDKADKELDEILTYNDAGDELAYRPKKEANARYTTLSKNLMDAKIKHNLALKRFLKKFNTFTEHETKFVNLKNLASINNNEYEMQQKKYNKMKQTMADEAINTIRDYNIPENN